MSDSSEPRRLLLAGYHPLILEDSRMQADVHYDIHAVGAEEAQLLQAVDRLRPDVVMLDLLQTSSLRTIQRVRDMHPPCRVVALTGMRHADGAQSIFAAGASGVLYRFSAASELSLAVDSVLSGRQYLSAAFTTSSDDLERFRSHETGELSPTDKLVLRLVADGYPIDRIARSLGQSVGTVRLSITHLKRRFGQDTKRDLQQYAAEYDLDSEIGRVLAGATPRLYATSSSCRASGREKNGH
ncbi:MAG: response regulator transcription factor [Nitrospira sp.]|nr:response regulator transcription factor [Nitrospira sp.]